MITLTTKNGKRNGNGIIYGGVMSEWSFEGAPKPLFLVETDFGNRMRLTWDEVNEMFEIDKVMTYGEWLGDRNSLRNQNEMDLWIPEE